MPARHHPADDSWAGADSASSNAGLAEIEIEPRKKAIEMRLQSGLKLQIKGTQL